MMELKPCPFCGGKFKMSQEPSDNGYVAGQFYIYHEGGGSECVLDITRHFDNEQDAVTMWNTRASSSRAETGEGGFMAKLDATIDGNIEAYNAHMETAGSDMRACRATPASSQTKLAEVRRLALEEAAKIAEDEDGYFWSSGQDRNAAIGQRICGEIAARLRALASMKEG
jgi:hypothetical protein